MIPLNATFPVVAFLAPFWVIRESQGSQKPKISEKDFIIKDLNKIGSHNKLENDFTMTTPRPDNATSSNADVRWTVQWSFSSTGRVQSQRILDPNSVIPDATSSGTALPNQDWWHPGQQWWPDNPPDDRSWDSHVSESIFDAVDFLEERAPAPTPQFDEYSSSTDSLASARRLAWTSCDYGVDPATPSDGDFVEEEAADVLVAEYEEFQCGMERYMRSLE
jgi:hypothetical protein